MATKRSPKRTTERRTMRLSKADTTCIEFLKAKHNLLSDSAAMRFALNYAARSGNIGGMMQSGG